MSEAECMFHPGSDRSSSLFYSPSHLVLDGCSLAEGCALSRLRFASGWHSRPFKDCAEKAPAIAVQNCTERLRSKVCQRFNRGRPGRLLNRRPFTAPSRIHPFQPTRDAMKRVLSPSVPGIEYKPWSMVPP